MHKDTPLEYAYHWEAEQPDALWFTQPMGGGEVKTYTRAEGMREARRMAAYLESLDLDDKSHIAIFSKNSAWWVLADLAIWMAGHVSVPLYPTLPPETVEYVLEHSDSKIVFVGKLDGFEAMEPGIPDSVDRIELPLGPGTDAPHWNDLIADQEPMQGQTERDSEELATILYTSGSTGRPKGVMIKFGAMVAASEGIRDVLGITPEDRYLSYLPISHAFERWLGGTCTLVIGYPLWFAESIDTFVQDLKRAQPTLFISVPRLWTKFHQGVLQKMPRERLDFLLKIPIVSGFIKKKVLSGLGLEHVRFAGSGSAPIPGELIEWYRKLGLELLEGYGMSENFNYSHLTRPGEVRVGYVGRPWPEVEHRISDEGEIQVKSPGEMMGYYKNPEATEATFTDDGWLKTGDRGEIDEQDRLRITGRIKEIFKTAKGKYVEPSPIENKILLHDAIEMACVTGTGMPQPHAIVMLSEDAREKLDDDSFRKQLEKSLHDHLASINEDLPHHERMSFFAVVGEEWTPESGELTPTLKIKRRVIDDKYGDKAEDWHERDHRVVWVDRAA